MTNMSSFQIYSYKQGLEILNMGILNRKIGSSHLNSESSRSHSIYQVNLRHSNQTSTLKSYLNNCRFVDLAGCEKYKIPFYIKGKEREQITSELISINTSLSALAQCVQVLGKEGGHLPLRNSKLTRVLVILYYFSKILFMEIHKLYSLFAFHHICNISMKLFRHYNSQIEQKKPRLEKIKIH